MDPLHRYSGRLALRAIYLTKAISLVLQAMQIHFGIPHKSTLYRQFLTSSVSRINFLGFRLYRALPFLYELRCVLDWSCTTTSLTMYDWLKVCPQHSWLLYIPLLAQLGRWIPFLILSDFNFFSSWKIFMQACFLSNAMWI